MKRFVMSLCSFALICQISSAWGELGHQAIAEVAQAHLTPKASKAVARYLDGMKLASLAADADNLDGAYINNDCYYVEILAEKLKKEAEAMDPEEVRRDIALITHFLGDMYCPLHIVYLPDNTLKGHFEVTYRGKVTNYHSFWDGPALATFKGGFLELAYLVDTKSMKEIKSITAGDVYDWGKDSAINSLKAYEAIKPGDVIPNTFPWDIRPLAYEQLRNAGYRLAAVLNEIFD